ncbi:hypothetical protein OG422_29180 [Streptomyces sp. NBC_01525]|uniref:hypothetical protein n=1 Tax=Streptomyces sp. NBC_01525 TaxID=2903893 RepID=UPI00386E4BA3
MERRSVDPRDISWEQENPAYRVYFWDKESVTSHEFEVTDSTIDEVLSWTRSRATEEGWEYTLYVKVSDPEGDGLVRIDGLTGDPFA